MPKGDGQEGAEPTCIYGTNGNVSHHTSRFILKTLYFTPGSGTNQNARENVAISEISEATQILSPVQKQDHLDNPISKYVPSIRHRLRDPPSAVKYLARPPGQSLVSWETQRYKTMAPPTGQV